MKQKIARLLEVTKINNLLFWLSKKIHGSHIRAINYHGTPLSDMANFERQLKFYSKHYTDVDYTGLTDFLDGKVKYNKKPGLILTFDDGLRSNYANALPLLEQYGFTAWFMIPSQLPDANKEEQSDFIGGYLDQDAKQFDDSRYIMNWVEISNVMPKHVIGCHTHTHHRMNFSDSSEILDTEILRSKELLSSKCNRDIKIFCWVGGEEIHYTKSAAEKIRSSGYTLSFMTNTLPIKRNTNRYQLQRTNIESNNPISLLKFQLNGLMDLYYIPKCRRVNRLTA